MAVVLYVVTASLSINHQSTIKHQTSSIKHPHLLLLSNFTPFQELPTPHPSIKPDFIPCRSLDVLLFFGQHGLAIHVLLAYSKYVGHEV